MADQTGKKPRRTLRIGKYEVIEHIASGGMGAVYRALDTETNRPVALKVLMPELAVKPAILERFRREAASGVKLRHENIVSMYEFGEANGTHYLAMEYVDGKDLHDYITRHGRLKPEVARDIIVQAARALDHADRKGIVHRDIKPSNFLITEDNGRLLVKLTDMGLAKQIREDEFRVTRLGTTVGTVDYMAPEQARNSASADIRSDIYSLGCTLYHMLAGCAPFPEGSMAERIYKHVEADPPDIRTLNPDVPAALVTVLGKMLQKRPENRYQSPFDLVQDLENLDGVQPSPSRGDGLSRLAELAEEEASRPAEPRRRRTPAPAGALIELDDQRLEVEEVVSEPEEEVVILPSQRRRRFRPDEATAEVKAPSPRGVAWWLIPVAGVVVLGIGILVWSQLGDSSRSERKTEPLAQNDKSRPVFDQSPPQRKEQKGPDNEDPQPKAKAQQENPPPKKQVVPPETASLGPPPPEYPPLYRPLVQPNAARLQAEFIGPFAESLEPPADATTMRVGRALVPSPLDFGTLEEALTRAPAEQPLVIELHDNGPLFTGPLPVQSVRRLWIRAAPGYRPLIAWEHTRRKDPKGAKDAKDAGTSLLPLSRSTLVLEDVDVVTRWPEGTPAAPPSFFALKNSALEARRCTFSLAGRPAEGVAVVQIARGLDSAAQSKARLSHCVMRGAAASAVRIAGCGADVLIDDCLIAGGDQPLLAARTGDNTTITVRVLRSTLVGAKTVLDAHPTGFNDAVALLCCDTLLARSDARLGGEMVRLAPNVNVDRFNWRGVNCIFAGWDKLFTSSTREISSQRPADWLAQWSRQEGIQVQTEAWPRSASLEPEQAAANAYTTEDNPVSFAAVSTDGRMGCAIGAVPAGPEQWRRRTFNRYLVAAPTLAQNLLPPIPPSSDGLYHGERIDLSQFDLNEVLRARLQNLRPAPRVVLHLAGQGERPLPPLNLRRFPHLVLYAEPADKGTPLTFVPDAKTAVDRDALFEIDEGVVEMIGVRVLFKNDKFASMPRYMFRIKQGELRLAGCYLQGPLTRGPEYFQGLFDCQASTIADAPARVTAHESVLVAAPAILHAQGGAAQLRVKQSVVIAPRDVLHLDLGPRPTERLPLYALLENNTFAVRHTFLRVADAPSEAGTRMPAVVQAQGNLFLDPFAEDANQSCLLQLPAETLARGELLWQGAANGFDKRLAAFVRVGDEDAIPGGSERWTALWGATGERKPLLVDLPTGDKSTFKADAPRLDRLALPSSIRPERGEVLPGANLLRLGIQKKKN